jgi:small ligand-binding sensory domain FIST
VIAAGLGISTRARPRQAGAEAAASALAAAGGADAALVSHGVLGQGRELEGQTAVAVLAWRGVEATPFLVRDASGDELGACEEIAAHFGGPPRPEDLLVLLPDPRSFHASAFLAALREVVGPARVVGAGAADPTADEPLQWCGRVVGSGGIAGMVIRCKRPPRIGVTQACRPVTELLTVTRSRGHWVLELDGRPALDVYRQVARGPLAADLRRAAAFVLVALPLEPGAEGLCPGSYLVRQVVGFEEEANAFAIPEVLKPGDRLALAQREPETARDDLKAMLDAVGGPPGAFGLYFDCCARGSAFFGVPGLEAAYLERAFGDAPLLGMFGSCEIGPVGPRTEYLTHTGVLALVDG